MENSKPLIPSLNIIHETPSYLVIIKESGVLVHKDHAKEQKSPILVDAILKKYPEISQVGDEPSIRPGIVHRLDRDTTGLLIIPKDQLTFEYFKNLFKKHQITKKYQVVVWGILRHKKGIIDIPIGLKSGSTERTTFLKKVKMIKEAKTEYQVLEEFDNKFSLLEVTLHTGRTHQIRVHLKSIGHTVVGDTLYGKDKSPITTSQMVNAYSLDFIDNEGNSIHLKNDLKEQYQKILKNHLINL